MALPRWLWDRNEFLASWAWGWKVKSRQRREALKLAARGEKHPDPHVAALARRFVETRSSTREFTIGMISFIAFAVIAATALELWTSLSAAGGLAAGIAGVGSAIWQRRQASGLANTYGGGESD